MSWTTHHRREDAMRDVIATVDARADGRLPMDLPGVAETFGDARTLLGALQVRWHTRLAGRIERELDQAPHDPAAAIAAARRLTARELPGVRAVLDRHGERQRRPENENTT